MVWGRLLELLNWKGYCVVESVQPQSAEMEVLDNGGNTHYPTVASVAFVVVDVDYS